MSTSAAPLVAAEFEFLGSHVTVRVAADQTDGRLSMLEMALPAGDQSPLHVHHAEDETFVVLEGELMLFQPGREVRLGAGESLLAARGIPHAFLAGPTGARVLVINTPGGFAAFAAEVSRIEGLPSPDELTAIAARHDIEILGPPGERP